MLSKGKTVKLSHVGRSAAVLAIGALALTACGSDNPTGSAGGGSGEQSGVSGTLTGIGASSQQAAMTAWQNGFQSANSGATVQYSPDGSGAGRKAFLAGGANFAGSDAYLSEDEVSQAKQQCGDAGAMDLPVYVSPISVAFNLPGVKSLNLDAPTIAKIFKGEIKKWDDEAIKSENEGVDLPSKPIEVVYRSDESGTSDNFQKFLSASTGEWDSEGKQFPTKVGTGAPKSKGVADQVAQTDGAITYVESGFAEELDKVNVANIDFGAGPVELNKENVNKALSAAEFKGEGNDLVVDSKKLYSLKGEGEYPLVLTTYEIVCSAGYDENTGKLVKNFLYTILDNQNDDLADQGYIPLDGEFKSKLEKAVDALK